MTYVLHYTSADAPGADATWSVYVEEYVHALAAEPIDGSQRHVSTHASEAEAVGEAWRLQEQWANGSCPHTGRTARWCTDQTHHTCVNDTPVARS